VNGPLRVRSAERGRRRSGRAAARRRGGMVKET
jgi:hypothetical protein